MEQTPIQDFIRHCPMNNKYIKQKYIPLLWKSVVAILVVFFISSYFRWPLDWFVTFYLLLLVYYAQTVYKFQYKKTRDIVSVVASACSTIIVIPVYWMIYKHVDAKSVLFQFLSLLLYLIAFSLLWLLAYFWGSDSLKAQLEKNIK